MNHSLGIPTGKTEQMFDLAQEYIFGIGMHFMQKTMMKKPQDIGSFDMKFFDIGKNLASLYYKATKTQHKLRLFKLLSYMQTSENCSRYLSDVKHPARKLKNNEELQKLEDLAADEEESKPNSSDRGIIKSGNSSKSSICANKITELCNLQIVTVTKEGEFETMI